ncbi:unnamed protein product [Chrysoparadoxa australica]
MLLSKLFCLLALATSICDVWAATVKLMKQETGSNSLKLEDGSILSRTEVAKLYPQLAELVAVGEFGHRELKRSGYAYGELLSVQGMEGMEGEGAPRFLNLTVFDGKETHFEIIMAYDAKRYLHGLALLGGYQLGDVGKNIPLEVEETEQASFWQKNYDNIKTIFGIIITSSVVRLIRRRALGDSLPGIGGARSEEKAAVERKSPKEEVSIGEMNLLCLFQGLLLHY